MTDKSNHQQKSDVSDALTKRKWPKDILLLAGLSASLWSITLIWQVFDLDQKLSFGKTSEADTWLMALSGLIFLVLIFAEILRACVLILALPTWLLAVNLCLLRLSAKKRWLITIALTLLLFPYFGHLPAVQASQTTSYVSTAVFDYNGQRVTQVNAIRCSTASSELAGLGQQPHAEGDRHWLKRTDGSIIIFPDYQSCMTDPVPDGQLDLLKVGTRSESRDKYTLVFDSSDNPTKADFYSFGAFTTPEPAALLRSVTLTKSDTELTQAGLAQAFAGMERLFIKPSKGSVQTTAAKAPGEFVGLVASVTQLAPNSVCGPNMGARVLLLPAGNRCIFFNDCDKSGPMIICGKPLGNVRIDFDPSFTTARLKPDVTDQHYLMTLYDSQRLSRIGSVGQLPVAANRWLPQVCLEDVCGKPDSPSHSMAFYIPAKRLLVEVRSTRKLLRREDFSQSWP